MTAVQFLRNVIAALPYKINTLLTDNGAQFTHRKQDKSASTHLFDRFCQEHNIKHRLTKINHPWTNGWIERMNRTIKEATVKRYHYGGHEQLKAHLSAACLQQVGRQQTGFPEGVQLRQTPKNLKRLTPYEEIIKWCQRNIEMTPFVPDRNVPLFVLFQRVAEPIGLPTAGR